MKGFLEEKKEPREKEAETDAHLGGRERKEDLFIRRKRRKGTHTQGDYYDYDVSQD